MASSSDAHPQNDGLRVQSFSKNLRDEIQRSGLITNEGGFFDSLRPIDRDGFRPVGLQPSIIDNAAHAFTFSTTTDASVTIDVHYFRTCHIPTPNVVIYGRFVTSDGALVAIWASTVFLDAVGKRGSEVVVVEKNMHRDDMPGFGHAFIQFYNQLIRQLQLDYDFIRAAWIGRKVWARIGDLQFDTRYTFLVDNRPMSQADLIAANFQRFLRFHDIQPETLQYICDDGAPLPFPDAIAGNRIGRPVDYLRIVSATGARVTIAPLIDYQVLGKRTTYTVGEAFVLSDNRPYEGQPITIRYVKNGTPLADGDVVPPNNRFSDRAMPPWVGIRHF